MTTTITISDSDSAALREIRDLAARAGLDGARVAVLDRILSASRPSELDARDSGMVPAADRGAREWDCPECGSPCVRDCARLVWNCHGCLATYTDETQLDSRPICSPASLVTAVALHPLPRGGRAVFTFWGHERSVYLPVRRFQLVWALLIPLSPHDAGDLIPNADLIEQVWADNSALGSRRDLNVLITRCRQDLVSAGLSAAALIERAPGGGATRLRLAPGARVTIGSDTDGPAMPSGAS